MIHTDFALKEFLRVKLKTKILNVRAINVIVFPSESCVFTVLKTAVSRYMSVFLRRTQILEIHAFEEKCSDIVTKNCF